TAQDNVFTGGGSKDDLDISQWRWLLQSPNDKTDLLPVGAAHYTDVFGNTFLYWHASLFSPNGSAAGGISLLTNHVSLGPPGASASQFFVDTNNDGICQPTETTPVIHRIGDVALQYDFIGTQVDPSIVTIKIFRWVGGLSNAAKTTQCTSAPPTGFGGTLVG